eukprot:TRINITY_DN29579_c0_g1_i1.p1 TRINITY_DN29579_c0_g1~~TRINITY_DN29579_c0_g1_i1.p1  ORF type:complete len:661 (+),score=208.93 TRINITY_DN29579_c0_g1_i1:84-1985(+)
MASLDDSLPPRPASWRALWFPLAAARLGAAAVLPIADCDETYNYWEPTHWLLYGSGFQTWEWSPAFALRSWLYVGLHAAVGVPAAALGLPRPVAFFCIRAAIALLGAATDAAFAAAAGKAFGPRVGAMCWWFMLCSAGTTAAGIAYLPSSAAMQLLAAAGAAQMQFSATADGESQLWGGIGACVAAVVIGWPFVGLLCIPIGLSALRTYGVMRTVLAVVCCTSILTALVAAADTYGYGRPVMSPWELVKYNVLGCLPVLEARKVPLAEREGLLSKIGCIRDPHGRRGSHLYGVEPWHFFFKNLALNFNVAFPLALLCPLALVAKKAVARQEFALFRSLWHALPFQLWFAFWLFVPHKEERFMAPAYPFLCLCAAMGLDAAGDVSDWVLGSCGGRGAKPQQQRGSSRGVLGLRAGRRRTVLLLAAVLVVSAAGGVSRTLATVQHYSAPLQLARHFAEQGGDIEESVHGEARVLVPAPELVFCMGKEWYRFHSSFFTPPVSYGGLPVRVGFINSSFGGLLPKPFGPKGSRSAPRGFNDLNQPDPEQFTPLEECHYLLDSDFAGQSEERYMADTATWITVAEQPYLDAARSPQLARALLLPPPLGGGAVHGRYALLRRRSPLSPAQQRRARPAGKS